MLPVMPIWVVVACGRITVIDVLNPRTSEKMSQFNNAIEASSRCPGSNIAAILACGGPRDATWQRSLVAG